MIVYTARHVLPVASPAVADGAVAVHEGRIVAAGRRHEVVKPQHCQDLATQIVAPGEPRLARLGRRQWLELRFEEGPQHSLRLVSREQLLVQPAFPRPVFRQSGG